MKLIILVFGVLLLTSLGCNPEPRRDGGTGPDTRPRTGNPPNTTTPGTPSPTGQPMPGGQTPPNSNTTPPNSNTPPPNSNTTPPPPMK